NSFENLLSEYILLFPDRLELVHRAIFGFRRSLPEVMVRMMKVLFDHALRDSTLVERLRTARLAMDSSQNAKTARYQSHYLEDWIANRIQCSQVYSSDERNEE